MKLSDVFSKALFKTPKYNAFPQSNEVKFSGRLGKLYPVQRWLMNPGDSIDVNLQQLIRFSPLTAPIMHNFQVDFQAIEIPDRLAIPYIGDGASAGQLDGGFENFHNLNRSRNISMPKVSIMDLMNFYVRGGFNPVGSIFDFLGFPVFDDLYRLLVKEGLIDRALSPQMNAIVSDAQPAATDKPDVFWLGPLSTASAVRDPQYSMFALTQSHSLMEDITYQGREFSFGIDTFIFDFVAWLIDYRFELANDGSNGRYLYWFEKYNVPFNKADTLWVKVNGEWTSRETNVPYTDYSGFVALAEKICEDMNFPMTKAIEEFSSYVFMQYLQFVDSLLGDMQDPDLSKKYSLLPLYSFWSAYYDWFINTNIEANSYNDNKLLWLVNEVGLVFEKPLNDTGYLANYGKNSSMISFRGGLPNRKWADDYFTSAFLEPAQGGNVPIPSGTIQDLRNASSLQKLYEKLMYSGRRYIDQVLGIFGVKSSNERLDRCRVLGVASFGVNVSDVVQTSQDTSTSRLGDYSGNAITVGQNRSFIRYTAEEHSIIMVFMSVRPKGVYMDETPKDLFKLSPLDFLIPELAHVGEQPVLSTEIVPGVFEKESEPTVFGYQRRYAEYMYTPSHVHGEFKTSLRYWNAARIFDDGLPVLNSDFINVSDENDGLNRIFAVPDAIENLRCFLYFDTVISRPLSKFVEYHF